jgi:hypothetical protein
VRSLLVCALAVALPACNGQKAGGGGDASAVVAPPASGSANAEPIRPEPPRNAGWTGTYKSAAAPLYIPRDAPNAKEWNGVKWEGDNSPDGIGDGALEVSIDLVSGQVTGTLDGPLGPATLTGLVADKQFSAKVARKDQDRGFTGTAVGSAGDDKIEGTMRLSTAEGNVIRSATFTLSKK